MPFDNQNLVEIPLGLFGGGCFEMSPENVPEGASPWLQDCEFFPGGVKMRRGLQSKISGFTGNVNYVDTYQMLNGDVRTLFLDSAGNLFYEDVTNNPGVLHVIGEIEDAAFDIYGDGFTHSNGTKYIAFSDGQKGYDIPMQYNGSLLRRVSQDGPGIPPTVVDNTANPVTIKASPMGFLKNNSTGVSLSELGNIVTINASLVIFPNYIQPQIGDTVLITGASVSGYNGSWQLTAVTDSSAQFYNPTTGLAPATGATVDWGIIAIEYTPGHAFAIGGMAYVSGATNPIYDGDWDIRYAPPAASTQIFVYILPSLGVAASGGGTMLPGGNITAGLHQVRQAFLTDTGYITRFSPPGSWTASGSLQASVSGLVIGPPNVVARILAFTATGGDAFFIIQVPTDGSSTGTQINDNTSTTAIIDFSDDTLLADVSIDTPGNNLINNVTLQPCLGVLGYKGRLAWWGECNSLHNLLNMSFDGGFIGDTPTGWTTDATNGAGGNYTYGDVVWGFSYFITGDGATALRGMITQPAYQDYNDVPILLPNTSYSVRLSLSVSPGAIQGNAVVELYSPTAGSLSTFVVPVAFMNQNHFMWFEGVIGSTGMVVPTDLLLRCYVSGTLTNSAYIVFDEITIFPTNQPVVSNASRISYVDNPETYDGVTGEIQLEDARGESIFSAFELRGSLYFNTDGGRYETSDNLVTEPSGWDVNKAANSSGTVSVHGTISGENWEITVGRAGAYMFSGGEPLKITQEINTSVTGVTPAWDQINWDYGYTIWGVNNVQERIIYIGVPMGDATKPNVVWMIDYKELQDASQIASSGPIHTSYAGKVISWEPGRKTSPWNMRINSAAMVLRQDNSYHFWAGNGSGSGKVYEPTEGQFSDDGAAIDSFYATYMLPSQMLAQQDPRLGIGRMLFSFLRMYVSGSGILNINALPLSITNTGPSYTLNLSSASNEDMESPIRVAGERCAFKIGTNAVGSWWSLGKFSLRLRRHPWSVFRHVN